MFHLDVHQVFATHTSATRLQTCLEVVRRSASELAYAVGSTTRKIFARGTQRHKTPPVLLVDEMPESNLGQGRLQKPLKVVVS